MSTGVKRAMSDQENQQLEAAPSAERQSVDRGHRNDLERREFELCASAAQDAAQGGAAKGCGYADRLMAAEVHCLHQGIEY